MLVLLTLGGLISDLRRARGLSQAALAEAVGVTRSTLALIETKPKRSMHDATSRAILECLAAAAPLSDEQCARFLELSGLSTRSKNGVLEDEDRAREIELGVLADPEDADGHLRARRRAFSTYGARIARARDMGLDQLARTSPTHPDPSTSAMVLAAHRLVDEIAAAGGALAIMGALLPLAEDAKAGRIVGAPRELNAMRPRPPQLDPSAPVADVHRAYPDTGHAVSEYSPANQPPASEPSVPLRTQAKKRSG